MNSDACRPIYRWKALNLYFLTTQRRFVPSIVCSLDSVSEPELFGGMKIRLIRTWREGEQERGNRRAETAQLSSTSWPGYMSRYPEWCSLCAACGEKANNVHQMSATVQNVHLPSQTNQTKTRTRLPAACSQQTKARRRPSQRARQDAAGRWLSS